MAREYLLLCRLIWHAQGEKATDVSAWATFPIPTAAPGMDAVQDSELRVSVERAVVWTPRTASTRTSQDLTEAEVRATAGKAPAHEWSPHADELPMYPADHGRTLMRRR